MRDNLKPFPADECIRNIKLIHERDKNVLTFQGIRIIENCFSQFSYHNKKVLLRERKRHTARRVVSTPSVVLPGYPPGGEGGPDPGTPLGGYLTWVPPQGGYLTWVPPGGT